jgi:hypothetical protein
MELRIQAGNTGSGSLIIDYGQTDCRTTTVQVETLDSIIQKDRIETIRFIKIDVEGFEAEVFRGASRVLKSVRPQAILFESVDENTSKLRDRPVFEILQASGYRFLAIPKCRFRMHLEHIDPNRTDNQGITDFLAVQKNDEFDQIAAAVNARST